MYENIKIEISKVKNGIKSKLISENKKDDIKYKNETNVVRNMATANDIFCGFVVFINLFFTKL